MNDAGECADSNVRCRHGEIIGECAECDPPIDLREPIREEDVAYGLSDLDVAADEVS